MVRAATGLAVAGVHFDRIFSSPYLRALETARLVADAQPGKPPVELLSSLASGLLFEQLSSELSREDIRGCILLVGHEPDMGLLAASLIGLETGGPLPFSPGTIARIDIDSWPPSHGGSLVWVLTARLAASLAG